MIKSQFFSKVYRLLREYKHEVVNLQAEKHNISQEESEAIFQETKKFLYLLSWMKEDILLPPPLIDEWWKQFISFERDYGEFCLNHFGRILRYNPHNFLKVEKGESRTLRDTVQLAEVMYGLKLHAAWDKSEIYPFPSYSKKAHIKLEDLNLYTLSSSADREWVGAHGVY